MVAAVLAVLWVLHERRYGRTREPVVSLDLFKIRSYVLGAGRRPAVLRRLHGTFFILSQYLQIGLHYSALQSGLTSTPFAVGGALDRVARQPPRAAPRAKAGRRSGWPW